MSGYGYGVCPCHDCTCPGCATCDPPDQDPEVREHLEWIDYLDAVATAEHPDAGEAWAGPVTLLGGAA